MSRPHAVDRPPRLMLGRYELLGQLGAGGMGSVFLARLAGMAGFERLFAVKVMHPHIATEPAAVTMLLDEARLAARIHHPNALGILDVFESEHGYCLVMEYVEGVSLDQILGHPRIDADTRMRLGLRCIVDAATGLHAAHELSGDGGQPLGLVHRDVSPHNMLMGTDGSGRIIDFGVARAAQRVTATKGLVVKGKPAYMAPEQISGRRLDGRADVFALGVVLWEALSGKMLFGTELGDDDGSDLRLLQRVLHEPIPRPSAHAPAVPAPLEAVCMRALERAVDARFATARAFADALDEATRNSGLVCSQRQASDLMLRVFEAEVAARRKLRDGAGVVGIDTPLVRTQPWTPVAGSGLRPRTQETPLAHASGSSASSSVAGAEPPPRRRLTWLAVVATLLVLFAATSVVALLQRKRSPDVAAVPAPPTSPVRGVPPPLARPAASSSPGVSPQPLEKLDAVAPGLPQAPESTDFVGASDGALPRPPTKAAGSVLAPQAPSASDGARKTGPRRSTPESTLPLELNPYD